MAPTTPFPTTPVPTYPPAKLEKWISHIWVSRPNHIVTFDKNTNNVYRNEGEYSPLYIKGTYIADYENNKIVANFDDYGQVTYIFDPMKRTLKDTSSGGLSSGAYFT